MVTATVQPATVSITNFGMYVSATSVSAKMQCAKDVADRYGQDYSPGTDFYHPFRAALITGRQQNADVLTLRRMIASQTDRRRVKHYLEMEPLYLAWLAQNPGTFAAVRSALWSTTTLNVSITPEYALKRPKGSVDVVKFYLRTEPLTRDGADAMLYLLDQEMRRIKPGGAPVVVDLRRAKTYRPRKNLRRGFGQALAIEANSLAQMWRAVA